MTARSSSSATTATDTAAKPPSEVLGRRVVATERADGGYTPGWRGALTLDDGRRVFVKSAGGADAGAIRREARTLSWLESQGSAQLGPRLLDFVDGEPALLVLEDLADAYWPPPYPTDTSSIFATLAALARVEAPADFEALENWAEGAGSRWQSVAADPTAFLRLGVCSAKWLERHADQLIEAERRIELRGSSVVHNDVHSGNMCFVDGRAVLTDWASAARGNPELDVAFAVVSVLVEGGSLPGRPPLADEGAWAARLAGHNAVEASSPLPDWAEPDATLRLDQLKDLRVALPWAARALGLPMASRQ